MTNGRLKAAEQSEETVSFWETIGTETDQL